MFAIMGSTGNVGGAALRALLKDGQKVRGITRRPALLANTGAETVTAGAKDTEALAEAFAGADGVFVMLPPPVTEPDIFAASRAAIDAIGTALRRAKPAHVVALSSEGAQLPSGTGPVVTLHELEAELARTGLPTTILRPTYFMENWAAVLPAAAEAGILPSSRLPLETPGPMVATADIGAVVAQSLRDGAPNSTRVINILGPQDYSGVDAAAILSTHLGRPVAPVPMDGPASRAALLEAGLSESYADALVELYDAINSGLIDPNDRSGEIVHGTVTLDQVLGGLLTRKAG